MNEMNEPTMRADRYTVITIPPARTGRRRHAATDRRQPDPRSSEVPADAIEDRATALTELSSLVSQLHAILARLPEDDALQTRVMAAIHHLEAGGDDLCTRSEPAASAKRPSPDPSGRTDPHPDASVSHELGHPTGGVEDQVEAFLTWLAFCNRPLPHATPRREPPGDAFDRFIIELCASQRILPADVSRQLGLAPGSTVGAAAQALRQAVHDPDGPRCPSYLHAVYHLQDHPVTDDPASLASPTPEGTA